MSHDASDAPAPTDAGLATDGGGASLDPAPSAAAAADAWRADHDVVDPADADPHLARIQRFPVKSLDPEIWERATLDPDAALAGDREWAMVARPADAAYDPETADVSGAGDYVNGKRTAAVHRLRSRFHPPEAGGPGVTLRETDAPAADARRFALADGADGVDPAALDAWLSDYFDEAVSVRREVGGGQHDDRERHGPTLISTATLREVAAWFGVEFDLDSARRRFRANLEVGGVPPFWEDRLFADAGSVVAVRVGEATVEGVHPCQRCAVPARDPDTGAETPEFRATFVRRRAATLPPWTASDRFDHPFRLMVNTRVPDASAGDAVAVGDAVEAVGVRPE